MHNILKTIGISVVLLLIVFQSVQAYPAKDSAASIIRNLSLLYKQDELSERQYLDTIPRTIHLFQSEDVIFSNIELLQLLTPYREIVWNKKDRKKYKQTYYAILCSHAAKGGRSGEMLYYAERLSELEQKKGNSSSIASLTFVSNYYITKMAFSRNIALYSKHHSFIIHIPQMVVKGILERQEIMLCGSMFSYLAESAYRTSDSLVGRELEATINQLIDNVRTVYPSDKELLVQLQFGMLQGQYEKYLSKNRKVDVWETIQQLDELFIDPATPEYFKESIGFTVADKKAWFFLEAGNNDSADYYISLLGMRYRGKLDARGVYMVKKYRARLLYNKGLFKRSEDTLIGAMESLEVMSAATVGEVDELMYALTKAEEQQFLLAESAQRQKRSDRQLAALSLGSFFLLSSSLLVFGYMKRRQKTRFLNFKLKLARNIHDETNPALMYARILAKNERPDTDAQTKTDLEKHIEHTAEVIRGLSHDLKSDRLKTIGDLDDEIAITLNKLNTDNTFTYSVTVKVERSRLLSHHQFSNLKSILYEAISNTIKHANFNSICILIFIKNNQLHVNYKDNGKGWDERAISDGIGMGNMKERVANMNGDWSLDNNYPDGYQIKISVPVR